ncbi:ATP-dependent Clp protease adaptor ClpS [Chryseobacterium taklimakanense]|uniref:ATP-dependent Clp protease adaptor n=1 Tax=Chryseobacterium taklimakanense TaxID=536441 RepID=A0A239WM20_9FLAO|nr:ATP-dependent Clp protease adaptor ClpS [Chryseobacterium taklimakanense]AZI20262.1 ATP-dependent Clp protease adaptor ClpS [Chryseobacterium taklimakanense]AZI22899.1 ATP-dependent Clp protease adaptor ClpS [Chryseobacterium taklimakanense]SNV35527.1 ATP-dependent Clp protease adaptor [Chryseobacterium taklimakanense]
MNRRFYNIRDYENPQREYEEEVAVLEETDEENKLVLWNDDVNTFDFVIECLIEICGHTLEQAEQCTILVHYKGKCTVKTGSMEKLKPMHEKLLSRGLTSEIQ